MSHQDDIVAELVAELLAEEHAKLSGPPCADGHHEVRQRVLLRATGEVLDPTFGTCDRCLRTMSRADETAPWRISCGSGCKCRECVDKGRRPS